MIESMKDISSAIRSPPSWCQYRRGNIYIIMEMSKKVNFIDFSNYLCYDDHGQRMLIRLMKHLFSEPCIWGVTNITPTFRIYQFLLISGCWCDIIISINLYKDVKQWSYAQALKLFYIFIFSFTFLMCSCFRLSLTCVYG